jgi:hypothetical protein
MSNNNNNKLNRSTFSALLHLLITELPIILPDVQAMVGKTLMNAEQLVALLTSVADSMTVADNALLAWRHATLEAKGLRAQGRLAVSRIEKFAISRLGTESPDFAKLGFKPPTRTPRTSEQNVVAAARSKATRVARGTKTKKQKASIHGSVKPSDVLVSPSTPALGTPPAGPGDPKKS